LISLSANHRVTGVRKAAGKRHGPGRPITFRVLRKAVELICGSTKEIILIEMFAKNIFPACG